MKRISTILLLIFVIANSLFSAEREVPEEIAKKLKNALQESNALGKYYVIAFPPNDQRATPQSLDIFIASSERANVKLINSYTGDEIPRIVDKDEVVVFSSGSGEISFGDEVLVHEKAEYNSFIIESDRPISVYCLNSRRYSTDGYLAIPVTAWGNEYIHCAYYDWGESGTNNWFAGFVLLAAEDNTIIDIDVKGTPGTKTWDGRKVGDKVRVILDKGEVYMMTGDGKTQRQYDLTGTHVTANKPIGMIAFNQRTVMPQPLRTSRDHMVAMIPPLQAWGKQYTSVELDRAGGGGDMYRFVAGADEVQVQIFWYDRQSKEPLGYREYYFQNAGEFAEYYGNPDPGTESIQGTVYIKANKPIFVMQYCYSSSWDASSNNFDPFMFPVISVDQFTTKTIFQTPSNKSGDNEYLVNKFNLIAIGDNDDAANNTKLLSSIMLDGKSVVTLRPEIVGNQIPGTNLYWANLDVDIGPHIIEGETPFGGYIYGFATWDTYAWPAATAYKNLEIVDTLPPVITLMEEDCGLYKKLGTELRNYPPSCDDCPEQQDQGIIDFPTIITSDNFMDPYVNVEFEDEDWNGYPNDFEYYYIFEVEDRYADAYVEYALGDATGENFAFDTIRYEADSVIVEGPLDFGLVRVDTDSDVMIVEITSASDNTISLENIEIIDRSGGLFRIEQNLAPGTVLAPRSSATISLVYTPSKEWLDVPEKQGFGRVDLDTLRITTGCLIWEWPMIGQGGEPYINVSDWFGNNAREGVKKTLSGEGKTIKIWNWNTELNRPATWPLEVYGIETDKIEDETGAIVDFGPFTTIGDMTLDVNGDFASPIIIPLSEGDEPVEITDIEFLSNTSGLFERHVPMKTNAKAGMTDNISLWRVPVSAPGPQITGIIWPKQRVLSSNQDSGIDAEGNTTGESIITNQGTEELFLMEIEIKDAAPGDQYKSADGNFRIMNERFPDYSITNIGATRITIYPTDDPNQTKTKEVRIPVEFTPQEDYRANGNKVPNSTILATFEDKLGNTVTVEALLEGEVFLPLISPTDEEFVTPVLVNEYADVDETVTVTNTGSNAPLYIWSITKDPNRGQPGDFEFADPAVMPSQANPVIIPVGEDWTFDVRFRPSTPTPADIEVYLLYEHDGVTGENGDPITNPNLRGQAESMVVGHPKVTGLNVTGYDFGNIISCDNVNGEMVITNGASNDNFTITSIEPADGSSWADHPEFVFPNGLSIGTVINATESYTIDVDYVPSLAATNASSVPYIVTGDYDTEGEASTGNTLEGTTFQIVVDLDLPNLPGDQSNEAYLNPNEKFVKPGNTDYHMGVDVNCVNWASANITEIEFDIRYHFSWMQTIQVNGASFAKGAAMPADWTIDVASYTENVDPNDDEYRLLHVKASGTSAINNNGVLFYPYLESLYGDRDRYNPEIVNVTFASRDDCVTPNPTPGEVYFDFCTVDVQWLDLTLDATPGINVRYNDVTDMVEFDFGVPTDLPTTLEMYDMNGNLITTAIDEVLKGGQYQGTISTSNIGNGAYLIRYRSGATETTEKIMIAR